MADCPQTRRQRWCSLTLAFLHSRPTLIVISVLILIDCMCIIGQMMGDLQAMRIRFQLEEDNVEVFENHLKMASANKTSLDIGGISDIMLFLRHNMDVILSDRCSSYCGRTSSTAVHPGDESITDVDLHVLGDDLPPTTTHSTIGPPCITSNHIWIQYNEGDEELFVIGEMDLNFKRLAEHESHGILGEIHSVVEWLSFISVGIDSVMLAEVALRTVCRGRHFYKWKFEVFDTAIAVVAFVVDVVFLSGHWDEKATDSTTILILLLPWRFVRVVFSMIATMNHKHHIQMQQLKSAKRTSDERLTHARNLVLQMEKDSESLTLLCRRKGATGTEIQSCYCKTTTAAVSTFASTMLLISAPALSESSFYHQGSRGHLFRKVFDEAGDVYCEENNNTISAPADVVESDRPRILRRAGPRVVNVTPPLPYQSLGDMCGALVSVVEPCRRLLSNDETSTTESSESETSPMSEVRFTNWETQNSDPQNTGRVSNAR